MAQKVGRREFYPPVPPPPTRIPFNQCGDFKPDVMRGTGAWGGNLMIRTYHPLHKLCQNMTVRNLGNSFPGH